MAKPRHGLIYKLVSIIIAFSYHNVSQHHQHEIPNVVKPLEFTVKDGPSSEKQPHDSSR